MIDRAKFALRVKLLLLRGPKNHKDLILQWGLETGMIQLDEGWDVVGFYKEPGKEDMDKQRSRFKNGLMNFRRYLSDQERKDNSTAFNNPFQPKGNYGAAGGQIPKPFPGQAVTAPNRYPSFLADVIGRAYGPGAVPV